MAETPEGKVKGWLKRRISETFTDPIYIYNAPGGMFGRTGTPDRFILWRGVFIALEAKAVGNEPSPTQLRELRKIAAAGGIAAVITGKDENRFQAIVKAVMEKVNDRAQSSV